MPAPRVSLGAYPIYPNSLPPNSVTLGQLNSALASIVTGSQTTATAANTLATANAAEIAALQAIVAFLQGAIGEGDQSIGVPLTALGVKGDVQRVADVATAAGSPVVNSASGRFSPLDVGKTICIKGAGSSATTPMVSTIAAWLSPTQVRLSAAATQGATGCRTYWGSDDTIAMQAAFSLCATLGLRMTIPRKSYFISAPINIYIGAGPDNTGTGLLGAELDHMFDQRALIVEGVSRPTILATAAMSQMFRVCYAAAFDPTLSNLTPFKAEFHGFVLDGQYLAGIGIYDTYAREILYDNVAIAHCTVGAKSDGGFGGNVWQRCGFYMCSTCIAIDKTGDHWVQINDFWPGAPAGGTVYGVRCTTQGGNTKIIGNVINSGSGADPDFNPTTQMIGFAIEATGANTLYQRDYVIRDNELFACSVGVQIIGQVGATWPNTVYDVLIEGNHQCNDGRAVTEGCLVQAHNCSSLKILGNFASEDVGRNPNDDIVLQIFNCLECIITGNAFKNLGHQPIYLSGCDGVAITANTFKDVAQSSSGLHVIDLVNTLGAAIAGNTANQTSGSYGQVFIVESGTADYTKTAGNVRRGIPFADVASGVSPSHSTLNG